MTKTEKKRYEALLQRCEDIYSGAVGDTWVDDMYFAGAEELAVIIPAVMARLWPDRAPVFDTPGQWMRHFGTPKECAEFLWDMHYKERER